MKVIPDKRLFWFLKENVELDLDSASELDMFVQQTLTRGSRQDIKSLFEKIGLNKFKESFERLKHFLPVEVRRFWEDYFGDT